MEEGFGSEWTINSQGAHGMYFWSSRNRIIYGAIGGDFGENKSRKVYDSSIVEAKVLTLSIGNWRQRPTTTLPNATLIKNNVRLDAIVVNQE